MNTTELDRMAQAQLEEQGFIQLADLLGRPQLEPPAAVGRTSTLDQWVLFAVLVAMDVYLVVTLLLDRP
jgi:hypothetical protein